MTVQDTINSIREELKNSFSEYEKRQLANTLIETFTTLKSSDILLHKDLKIPAKTIGKIKNCIQKINAGEPVQYVLGNTYFYNIELKIDDRALIPRPETEELVDWIKEKIKKDSPEILDIGTGSGCIALALQKLYPSGKITGVDKERKALDLARENADNLQLDVSLEKVKAEDLENYFEEKKWDCIVANPPYIPVKEQTLMEDNVLNFEPHSALFVTDEDPLKFYRIIGEYAFKNLRKGGFLFFEINESLGAEVKNSLTLQGFKNVAIRKDLQGKERMICGQKQ